MITLITLIRQTPRLGRFGSWRVQNVCVVFDDGLAARALRQRGLTVCLIRVIRDVRVIREPARGDVTP